MNDLTEFKKWLAVRIEQLKDNPRKNGFDRDEYVCALFAVGEFEKIKDFENSVRSMSEGHVAKRY